MAVIQDPQGAFFCVWEPREHIGAQRVERRRDCWAELDTTDPESAAKFYTKSFPGRPRHPPRVHGVAVGAARASAA